jgi:hypothetical protein
MGHVVHGKHGDRVDEGQLDSLELLREPVQQEEESSSTSGGAGDYQAHCEDSHGPTYRPAQP